MKILITSPRAPATLEWICVALRGQHRVTLCDSLRFPIGRFLSSNVRYCRIPAPRTDFQAYQTAIKKHIAEIDLVISTCEDIFYLANVSLTEAECAKCLMPANDLLMDLHHKIKVFSRLPATEGIGFPRSRLITQPSDIVYDNDSGEKTVLKPIFSRFGRNVIRGVTKEKAQHLEISTTYPWVQQQFITGEPLCNFAVCQHGELIANALYRPRYLLNQSASTYFEREQEQRRQQIVAQFMRDFAEQNAFHGQVAFDFIDDGEMLWVLECNPRATSGLHLLGEALHLSETGQLSYSEPPNLPRFYRVGASLPLLFAWSALKKRQLRALIRDYRQANDVLAGLPFYASWLAFAEVLSMSWRQGKSLSDISTFDIEYDGKNDGGNADAR
ncbi:MAG: carbamoyl-phosphate synthase large subunit [Gammaproteobacteria bacterium]|nr:MAG: carbamoyl-phosphate synthase large subunit [Gammaproteobacteria bacterium]